jgi:hypothetical protein
MRPGGAGDEGLIRARLSAGPDREEHSENEDAEDEGQGQEKNDQDQEWNRGPGDHRLSPLMPILGRAGSPVNQTGSNLYLFSFRRSC